MQDIYTTSNLPYCVYMTIYTGNKLPPYYIGSSSTDNVLNKNYYGSVQSKRYKDLWKQELKNNKHLFDILILSEHETRQEALEEELRVQKLKDVVKNPNFINLSFAQKDGSFGRVGADNNFYGHKYTEENPHPQKGLKYDDEKKKMYSDAQKKLYANGYIAPAKGKVMVFDSELQKCIQVPKGDIISLINIRYFYLNSYVYKKWKQETLGIEPTPKKQTIQCLDVIKNAIVYVGKTEFNLHKNEIYFDMKSIKARKFKEANGGKPYIPKKSHSYTDEQKLNLSNIHKERCSKEGYVIHTKNRVVCFDFVTKEFKSILKEEYDELKGIRYFNARSKVYLSYLESITQQ